MKSMSKNIIGAAENSPILGYINGLASGAGQKASLNRKGYFAVFPHRSRRLSSRSTPSRITSRRASPSSRTASRRATVSSVNGNVSRTGHCFFLPTDGAVSWVRYSAKNHLFRTYDIDAKENISYIRKISRETVMAETFRYRGADYPVTRTGAPPRMIDGIEFCCWRTGIAFYEWRSPDGRLSVWSAFRNTGYHASVDGATIAGANPKKSKKFKTIENAARAAIAKATGAE